MENLILIHGALGSAQEFKSISSLLSKSFNVSLYEIPHHGKRSDSDISLSIEELTQDLERYISKKGRCYIYGFCLGGYLALCLAQKGNKDIKGIITQGTNLYWSPEIAKKEVCTLNIDFLKEKANPFYEYLIDLHGAYLPQLLEKTVDFMLALGYSPSISKNSVKSINCPVRMIRGGKDKMVSKEETVSICKSMGNGYYFEIPSFIHPLEFLNPKHVVRTIKVQIESFEYKWVNTVYGDIAYKVIGTIDNQKPVLLFLHEAIGSIAQWKGFPELIAKNLGLPAVVLEFPGYGFSSEYNKKRNSEYLHHFAWDILPSFLKAISLEQEIIIIGHSDGGTNALLYSTRFPQKVKGIVTMAAHVLNEDETKVGIQPAIDAYESGKMKGLEMYHGQKTKSLFYAWANTWLAEDFSNWNISMEIRNNMIPALIIQGKEDQYGTVKQVNIICDLLENAEPFFISDCGHAPHLEQTKSVIEKIKTWSNNLQ